MTEPNEGFQVGEKSAASGYDLADMEELAIELLRFLQSVAPLLTPQLYCSKILLLLRLPDRHSPRLDIPLEPCERADCAK